MKIAIIGAGWIGCHLAKILKKNNSVDLYESEEIFSRSSSKNQNRLHIGYHYARNYETRELCKNTFDRFLEEYNFIVDDIPNNIYAISSKESLLDYKTYLKIYDLYDCKEVENNYLKNVSGLISVDEKYINPIKAKKYFSEILNDNLIIKKISQKELDTLKENYDYVINCSNNSLDPIIDNVYSETCHSLVYERIDSTPFNALTMVDGDLFSIYPYDIENNYYSLSHVKITPSSSIKLEDKKELMETHVCSYYEDFLKKFEYKFYYESVKVKSYNKSANRIPVIKKDNNYIKIFTGKIQGIYILEDYFKTI
jgi:hypothetical protein